MDPLAAILAFLCLTLPVAAGVVVWVLFRTASMTQRMDRLERELVRLKNSLPPAASDTVRILEAAPAEPLTEVVAPAMETRAPARGPARGLDLETWIGQRALGWVAVILLLLAAGFFVKEAFARHWVGPLGRVASGALVGTALCVAGFQYHRRGFRLFAQMLSAAGVVLLYLITYASFGFYPLLPHSAGGVFLVVLVAEVVGLSLLYDAPALAIMAVLGGLITPILLHTGRDQYVALFTYLIVLDAGAVALLALRAWPALGTVALVGTQIIFTLWYEQNYHPAKLGAALGFQIAVFVLFLLPGVLRPLRHGYKAGAEDLARLALNAVCFAWVGYVLLDEDYHVWMGSLALGLATVHAALGWLVFRRRINDPRQTLVCVAIAMGLVAVVFPLELRERWAPVGWAIQGTALWWFGLRGRLPALRGLGSILVLFGFFGLLPTVFANRPDDFVPIFNEKTLPALGVAASFLFLARTGQAYLKGTTDLDRVGLTAVGLAGVFVIWLALSRDTHEFWRHVDPDTAVMALSVVWAAYGAALLAVGAWAGAASLRWAGLVLFGVTLLKVFIVDLGELPGMYRAGAFLGLAVALGLAARLYQRAMGRRSEGGVP